MKTIEERADAYVGHSEEIDEFSSATIKRHAYIDGAKEQRKIDTDKALKYLEEALQCGVHPCSKESFIIGFKKAMEE